MSHNPGSDGALPPLDADGLANAPPSDLDYECLRLIGQGGYGEVWLVRDKTGRHLACKVIYRESFDNDRPYEREYEGIKKFEPVSSGGESQVKILHVGRRDSAGYFYYLMELADDVETGQEIDPAHYIPKTLKTELNRRGRLPASECVRIGLSLSAALENLHDHGLIHRDIKPANIIFVHGIPKLADIGLVTDADVTVTYVGTEGYIAPEGPGSAQGDIYGLSKVLYELSTGRDRLDYPELPTGLGELPDREALLELNAVIIKGCQKNPAQRYQTAGELHSELTVLTSGKSIRQRRKDDARKKTVLRIALVILLLMLAALGVTEGMAYLQKHSAQTELPFTPQNMVRLPAPPQNEVAKKETELAETYHQRVANDRQRAAAVAELLRDSAGANDPVMALASLRVAEMLELEAGHFYPALNICQTILLRFQIDPVAAKLELVTKASTAPRSPKTKNSLAEIGIAAAFEAIGADDYERAQILENLAEAAGREANDPHVNNQLAFLDSEMTRCKTGYGIIKDALETLRQKPNDPKANLAVGKYLCFVKNDWQAGLLKLSKGNDPTFREVLNHELIKPSVRPDDEKAAGDAWWNLAGSADGDDKLHFQWRAKYWYLKAIAGLKGENKNAMRQQLAERLKAIPAVAGEVHIFARVENAEHILIYSDAILWRSNRGSLSDRINYFVLGDLKATDSRTIRNTGAMRFYSEGIDFSTAQFVIDHKAKRGRASMEIADDHVEIILSDPPNGRSDLEVTVIFGGTP